MLKVPTVDEWFSPTLKYRDFHRVSHTVLKDYGYMSIMDYLDARPDAHRILEFGHGFNATLFERYGRQRDVWECDRSAARAAATAPPWILPDPGFNRL